MKNWFLACLLIPPGVILGLCISHLVGGETRFVDTLPGLVGASFWILLFLIFYGMQAGWPSVRVFIILFVFLNFGTIFHDQIRHDPPLPEVGLKLMGAAIITWLFSVFLWPEKDVNGLSDTDDDDLPDDDSE